MQFVSSYVDLGRVFPVYMTCLNFYRNIKGRVDLMCFLYKWDPGYRKDILVMFLTSSLLCYSIVSWLGLYDFIAVGIEIAIILIQLGGDVSIIPADYRPVRGVTVYSSENSTHVLHDKLSFPMSKIRPNLIEEKLGFTNPVENLKTCKESPLVSNKVDDRLMLMDELPYREEKSETNYVYSRHQLRYITARVANKKQHTTNGKLLGFSSLTDNIMEGRGVTVRKAFYYDALLTLEAFRSRLYRGNLNGDREVYTDLTTYFPVEKDVENGEEFLRFKPEFYKEVSDLVGVTSLLITENNRVAMLYQGANKVIGANSVYLGGSGGMDYTDLKKTGGKDFLKVVKHGLAREVCEETGMLKRFDEVCSNTIVTGFFRWIDRCGAPEFVGLTRAGDIPFFKNKSIDGDEVVKFDEVPIDIKEISDFKKVIHWLHDNSYHVTLSSLMALHRMVVIADYNNADATEEQKEIYKTVSEFLFRA